MANLKTWRASDKLRSEEEIENYLNAALEGGSHELIAAAKEDARLARLNLTATPPPKIPPNKG